MESMSLTTVDMAVPDRGFLGGSIMPGPVLMARALSSWTSLLPLVEPSHPATYPAKNTRSAINSGVVIGACGAARHLVARAIAAIPGAKIVITGGNAGFFADQIENVSLLDEDLVLKGILLAVAARGL